MESFGWTGEKETFFIYFWVFFARCHIVSREIEYVRLMASHSMYAPGGKIDQKEEIIIFGNTKS